jgi:hypothetical protein
MCDAPLGSFRQSLENKALESRAAGPTGETTMSDPVHVLKPATEDAPREIIDLAEAISMLPLEYRLRIEPLVNRVLDNAKRRRRILSLVQDALGQLRLDMKYLTFDLEATRRERDEYRQKLEG